MDVNFIVTCYDNEQHVPLLLKLITSYKKIKPSIIVSYSGQKSMPCDVKIDGTTPATRELAMTVEGYRAFKRLKNTNRKFVKLSARVWPVDENVLIDLLNRLEENKAPYGGNYWHHNLVGSLAIDFFVADTTYGDFMGSVTEVVNDSEVTLYQQIVVKMKKTPYIIPEREHVFWKNIFECKPLGLLMYEDPKTNLDVMKDWGIS